MLQRLFTACSQTDLQRQSSYAGMRSENFWRTDITPSSWCCLAWGDARGLKCIFSQPQRQNYPLGKSKAYSFIIFVLLLILFSVRVSVTSIIFFALRVPVCFFFFRFTSFIRDLLLFFLGNYFLMRKKAGVRGRPTNL